MDEQVPYGGLIIAEGPHGGPFGADDLSSAPAVCVQEVLGVARRHQILAKIEERRQLVIQPPATPQLCGQADRSSG
jgi:hypothetical protein